MVRHFRGRLFLLSGSWKTIRLPLQRISRRAFHCIAELVQNVGPVTLASLVKERVESGVGNATAWIPDSKTPNGIAEIPLTPLAIEAFKSQMLNAGPGPFLFPSEKNPSGHQKNLKTVWRKTLKRAGVPYVRIYDLRSSYATRLSAGGVADEWVTQLLRQGDARPSRSIRR